MNNPYPPSRIQRLVFHISFLAVIFSFLITGCTSLPQLPPSIFQLARLDTHPLKGRVIVIDPGHGGKYRGAIGEMGIKESEVNLGVALYLWGMLESAGAHPVLTRTADTTVAPPDHTQLRDDLTTRARIANDLNPDIFISIHHNSNVTDPEKNNLEIYFKLTDPGASRELAECIMHRIKTFFVIEKAQALPGNYSVLRETNATAILGEASYLTHRENERRLSRYSFLKLEAEAYFAGILDYFARGIPQITGLKPDGGVFTEARPEVSARISDDAYGKGIDPETIRVYLDGIAVTPVFDPLTGELSYTPSRPLPNGKHSVRIEAQNRAGNSAHPVLVTFSVALPPHSIRIVPALHTIPPDGLTRTRITATILDKNRNPVADGLLVRFSTSAGTIEEAAVVTTGGSATTHLIAGFQRGRAEVVARCENLLDSSTVTFADSERHLIEVYLYDIHGNPIEGGELFCGRERSCVTDHLGYCYHQPEEEGTISFAVWKDGYRTVKGVFSVSGDTVLRETLVLPAVADGFWWDKTIAIDPLTNREDTASPTDREREREDCNLKAATFLGEMLKLAGAKVILTRTTAAACNPIDKIVKVEDADANLLIAIDHTERSSIGYYFSSSRGKLLARYIRQAMEEELSCKKIQFGESTDFVLVHTSMPAAVIKLDRHACKRLPHDKNECAWKEAQTLYRGLHAYLEQIAR